MQCCGGMKEGQRCEYDVCLLGSERGGSADPLVTDLKLDREAEGRRGALIGGGWRGEWEGWCLEGVAAILRFERNRECSLRRFFLNMSSSYDNMSAQAC